MAKRLSTSTSIIRTQIETSKLLIETYKADLERTPKEDPHGRAAIQRDLKTEQGTLGRLTRHLDGLENEFSDMYETTITNKHHNPDYED